MPAIPRRPRFSFPTRARFPRKREPAADGEPSDGDAPLTESAPPTDKRPGAAALGKAAWTRAAQAADDVLAATQGALASSIAADLNGLMQRLVGGTATVYDKALDAVFDATHIGGYNHRFFDGSHTLLGAAKAGSDALPDDNIVQEAIGTLQALLRDVTTVKGLPLFTWDKTTYDQAADALASRLHIPKGWFADMNSYDAAELVGGAAGVIAVVLQWNRPDAEAFGKLVGSLGLSAAVGANPVLALVSVAALARAFHTARRTGDYAGLVDGQARGMVGTGSAFAAASLLTMAGGPVAVALLASIAAGVLAIRAASNVSVTQVSRVAARNFRDASADAVRTISAQSGSAAVRRLVPRRRGGAEKDWLPG